jgi:hypothetical protein
MCLDGFDTLLIGSPQEVLTRFRASSADILFGSTETDWPPSEAHRLFEIAVAAGAPSAHRHLNASYIGRTSEVFTHLAAIDRAILSHEPWCHLGSEFDDQLAWREMHRRHYPRLRIDNDCTIFVRFDSKR